MMQYFSAIKRQHYLDSKMQYRWLHNLLTLLHLQALKKVFSVILNVPMHITLMSTISAFIHMHSNGVVDRTEVWKTTRQTEGPLAKNNISVPQLEELIHITPKTQLLITKGLNTAPLRLVIHFAPKVCTVKPSK